MVKLDANAGLAPNKATPTSADTGRQTFLVQANRGWDLYPARPKRQGGANLRLEYASPNQPKQPARKQQQHGYPLPWFIRKNY